MSNKNLNCLLYPVKHIIVNFNSSREPTAVQNVLLGFSARSAAGVSLLPITVVKTRYEVSDYTVWKFVVFN